MFCSNCGTQLADEASFCLNCGAPTGGSGGSTQTASEGPGGTSQAQMEYSEMSYEAHYPGCSGFLWGLLASTFGYHMFHLEAIATGPLGRYHVAYSPTFATNQNVAMGGGQDSGEPALVALTDELIQDGWEHYQGVPCGGRPDFGAP
jgi:hypothetical protein